MSVLDVLVVGGVGDGVGVGEGVGEGVGLAHRVGRTAASLRRFEGGAR